MPLNDDRTLTAVPRRRGPRSAVTLVLIALPFVLAACSSGSSASSSATPTTSTGTTSAPSSSAATASTSATESASASDTASATSTPSTSSTPSATPSGTPSTVAPSPSGSVLGIAVAYAPVVATAGQQVSITASTNRSVAGRTAYVIKWNDGAPRVLGTGTVISGSGVTRTYVQLLRTGVLQVVVPQSTLPAGAFDPATPLLGQSARFTVTIRS